MKASIRNVVLKSSDFYLVIVSVASRGTLKIKKIDSNLDFRLSSKHLFALSADYITISSIFFPCVQVLWKTHHSKH